MAKSFGRASVRACCSASGGTLPIPTPDKVMPVLRKVEAFTLIVSPVIAPIWTNRVAWKCADG
ncbi:Uncharacterised protein [Mycobacteroides abscessus subsp. abscessus]|nr:Uncharacterised protein [Mycobacteroides abscessus subsp. abscessus]